MPRLGVNIDHVATIREQRKTMYPDPVLAAMLAEQAGAEGITVHLREDKRHIQPRDVRLLKETIMVPLNLEMAATEAMVVFALEIRPAYCCLVPERREEKTTEGGLAVAAHAAMLSTVCARLHDHGIAVSLFIEPEEGAITAAQQVGSTIIELHTGAYADAKTVAEQQAALVSLQHAAAFAHRLGLQVNAGHGLHYQNVMAVAAIPAVVELNIGHAIISRAIMTGMEEAVTTMKALIDKARKM